MCLCVSVWLSTAACLHYCTDRDVTWASGRGCPLVVHYWANLQSLHGLHCYCNIPGDGGGWHWLVRIEWRPAGWSVCLTVLIFPCTIKSRSSLLAPPHPGGPRKRAVEQLWCGEWCISCWEVWKIGLGLVVNSHCLGILVDRPVAPDRLILFANRKDIQSVKICSSYPKDSALGDLTKPQWRHRRSMCVCACRKWRRNGPETATACVACPSLRRAVKRESTWRICVLSAATLLTELLRSTRKFSRPPRQYDDNDDTIVRPL